MPLEVQPAVDDDAPRLAEIENLAYKDNPLSPILFPGPFPEDILTKRAEGLVQNKNKDPQVRWAKVVDTDTNEVIGWAQWEIVDGPKIVQQEDRTFGQGCNVEACVEYFGNIHKKRHELMDGKYYACMSCRPLSVCNLFNNDSAQPASNRPEAQKTWDRRLVDSMGSQNC